MQTNDAAALERAVTDERTDLQKRDVRALTEYMTVLPLGGGLYSVTTQSGSEYHVDALEGRCTCPDKHHNLEDGEICKHERRVRFATGEWDIPAWVNADEVDAQLGKHVSGTTETAATDDSDKRHGRPGDCDCNGWSDGDGLPCWPCYRDGFEAPNPEVSADE